MGSGRNETVGVSYEKRKESRCNELIDRKRTESSFCSKTNTGTKEGSAGEMLRATKNINVVEVKECFMNCREITKGRKILKKIQGSLCS